jgi:hypothetical protein
MSESIARIRAARAVPGILQRLKLAALAGIAALAAACGGGEADLAPGGPQPSACADCGTALLTITDAPGDFQSYAVDITSLELVKADGTVVQTLPARTRIDFAELVELGEVLAARQIPAGVYVSARLRVDYSDAAIVVEDATGGSLEVQPVTAIGQPAGEVELAVKLDERNRLVISPRRVFHLAFDLNLEASNTVDLAAGTVVVSPFVVASIVPPAERDWRVRGRLLEVDVPGSSYIVQVRPFHHHQHGAGELTVHTTGATTWEIDGVAYAGAAGLSQLATLDEALVIAFGTIDIGTHTFTAMRVLAGTSAEDLRREFLAGHVLSRTGDTLVVGAVRLYWDRLDATDGSADRYEGRFLPGPVTLTVGPGTKVTRAGQGGGSLDAGVISVGQRIQAFGDVSRNDAGRIVMDATDGLVRLNPTRLAGMVTAAASGALTLDLQSIGGLRPARFDFTGTGSGSVLDADPDAYEIALAAGLDTSSLSPGSWVGVHGFVAPFGTAPPDFNAITLIDYADTRAALAVAWIPGGSTAPFSAISASGLTLDTAATPAPTGSIHLGGAVVPLGSLAVPVAVVPPDGAVRQAYAIGHRSSARIDNFSSFTEFAAALQAELDGQVTLHRLFATGTLDAPASTFHARQVLVVLND